MPSDGVKREVAYGGARGEGGEDERGREGADGYFECCEGGEGWCCCEGEDDVGCRAGADVFES